MTGCTKVRDALGPYVLGALDPEEAAEVAAHLAGCEPCAAEHRGVAMQALYFATPIFFPAEQVPQLKRFIEFNPLSWIFGFFQDGIYYHRWPDAQQWLVAAGVSVGMFVLLDCWSTRRRNSSAFVIDPSSGEGDLSEHADLLRRGMREM